MALGKLFIILAVIVAAVGDHHEVQTENKAKKALATEKEQKSRSANPGRERGSFQKLSNLMNRTQDNRQARRRGKESLNKIHKINMKLDNMMNDNEGAIAINHKTIADNDTYTLAEKMKALRREGPTYEAVNKYSSVPQATGVYCNFENSTNGSFIDMCMWQWNTTVSSHGLGFKVVTAADVVEMNETTRGLEFSGPKHDADGNVGGLFPLHNGIHKS